MLREEDSRRPSSIWHRVPSSGCHWGPGQLSARPLASRPQVHLSCLLTVVDCRCRRRTESLMFARDSNLGISSAAAPAAVLVHSVTWTGLFIGSPIATDSNPVSKVGVTVSVQH